MLGNYLVAEQVAVSQKGPSSMELECLCLVFKVLLNICEILMFEHIHQSELPLYTKPQIEVKTLHL
jgi:hypothetical protein